MNRNEKEAFVASLRSGLSEASLVVVTRQKGLTVSQSTDLRQQIRKAGGGYKVAKNTLIRRAIEGTAHEALMEHLKGPVALAYSQDPIAAAKVAVEYANKNDQLEIVCGVLNEKMLGLPEVKALAALPSLDELRGKIIGVIQAPMSRMVGVLQAPAGQLARVFSAYSKKE